MKTQQVFDRDGAEELLTTSLAADSEAEQREGALMERSWVGEFVESRYDFVGGLNAVDGQGGKIGEKTLKAVHRLSLDSLFSQRFALGGW